MVQTVLVTWSKITIARLWVRPRHDIALTERMTESHCMPNFVQHDLSQFASVSITFSYLAKILGRISEVRNLPDC